MARLGQLRPEELELALLLLGPQLAAFLVAEQAVRTKLAEVDDPG